MKTLQTLTRGCVRARTLAGIFAVLAGTHSASAAKTTASLSDGYWEDIAWSDGAPAEGDTVTIAHNVALTNAPPALADLSVDAGKTLTFQGWDTALTAGVVTISGNVTHPAQSAAAVDPGSGQWVPDNRVWIDCQTLTLHSNGTINVDGKGYAGTASDGRGPGRGLYAYGGGGYGGVGGHPLATPGNAGQPYGDADAPVEPGSSGGGHSAGNEGGNGGGIVRLEVSGVLTVDGTISAGGSKGVDRFGAGGSGGGVLLDCDVFKGAGTILANGGNSASLYGGGGGGGRIAVRYTSAQTPSVRFSVAGGIAATPSHSTDGLWGTLSLSDTAFLPAETMQGSYRLLIPGFTNWAPDTLTISEGTVQFPDNFQLNVSNDVTVEVSAGIFLATNNVFSCRNLTVEGTLTSDRPVTLTGALNIAAGGAADFPGPLDLNAGLILPGSLTLRAPYQSDELFSCAGDLVITSSGVLHAWSGVTNGVSPGYGGRFSVPRRMQVAAGGTVYPYADPTNGGCVFFEVGELLVEAGGKMDADGRGYTYGVGNGYGPGGGKQYYGGGGYGGKGGAYASLPGNAGVTYGCEERPAACGSAGATHSAAHLGGAGGGLIWVQTAGGATVDGHLTANGQGGTGSWGSGGSGGGIYIDCRRTFAGVGVLNAIGGDSGTSTSPSSGGGGRIAVWSVRNTWSGTPINIAGVTNGVAVSTDPSNTGEPGTVFFGLIPPSGTMIMVR